MEFDFMMVVERSIEIERLFEGGGVSKKGIS